MNSLQLNYWLKQHWKLLIIVIIAVALLGDVIFQIVYPSSRVIPGTKVDGLNIGGLRKQDAAKKLDAAYGGLKLSIYFGKNDAAFQTPTMSEVGIGVDSTDRVAALDYPFYLRIIPGSLFWAPSLEKPGSIAYTYDKDKIAGYTQSKVGTDCSIPAKNASLKLIDSQLQVVPSESGGICDITEFQQKLAAVEPRPGNNDVRISINETAASVTDDMARDLAAKLNPRLAVAMPVTVDTATDTIPGRVVMSWLDFTAVVPEQSIDNSANKQASLQFSVNSDRMKDYLDQGIAAKLIVKPGISKVSTLDFNETSRVNGASGRDINVAATTQSVTDYINSKSDKAVGATQVVGPTVVYTRSYNPTSVGFSALLAQYAQDNPGTWGMAFTEVSGVAHLRTATYNADARIKAGGVHSLYIGYAELMSEAAGTTRPVDIVTGSTNANDCFKLMFEKSSSDCIGGFYNLLGYATLTSRGKELGLTNTAFAGDDTVTSANDLQKVMTGLFKGQVARTQSGSKIIGNAKNTVANDGIPAGVGAASTSHIIGETATVHNDTAIVYDSKYGNYILTVLSDGSSWDKVSGLAKKIATLKAVKEPKDAT
jgi:beta-lactamase class A